MAELRELMKSRRLALGKTLEQIGSEVGVSKATVQRWESGEIRNIRHSKLVDLARALHTTPGYLMGWDLARDGEGGASPPGGAAHHSPPDEGDEDLRFIARKMSRMKPGDKEMLMRMIKAALRDDGE